MRVEQIEFNPLAVVSEADALQSGLAPRSEGLHLSQVYGDIEATLQSKSGGGGGERREKFGRIDIMDLSAYRSVGFLFEHLMAQAMCTALSAGRPREWVRPGEFREDGVTGSPDLFDCVEGEGIECKATYRSFKKMGDGAAGLRDEFWLWSVQMKGYARLLGCRTYRLYTLFVNGDYTIFMPMFRAWRLTWTEQEIEENWQMILGHARSRKWL